MTLLAQAFYVFPWLFPQSQASLGRVYLRDARTSNRMVQPPVGLDYVLPKRSRRFVVLYNIYQVLLTSPDRVLL